VTYYYDLLLWNKFLQGSNWLFSFITPAWIFVAGSGVFVLGLLFLFLPRVKTGQQQKATLIVIIAIGGMAGMMFNLLILLNFQETFGSIYEMVGAMIAAHMLGLAGGALAAARLMRNYEQTRILLVALFTLISIVLLFPALLNFLLIARSMPVTLFVTMLIGGFIGILFGIVNRLYLRYSLNLGSVYAFDVLGSSLGALTACSVLLPVLGIQRMTYFFSLLIIPAIVGAWILRKEHA
jgi:predicted membrane-bound spermidine synthase